MGNGRFAYSKVGVRSCDMVCSTRIIKYGVAE